MVLKGICKMNIKEIMYVSFIGKLSDAHIGTKELIAGLRIPPSLGG